MDFIIKFIQLIHIIIIALVVIIPFTNNIELLLMHWIIVPFIVLHWILSYDTCVLTIIEIYLKNKIYQTDIQCEDALLYRLIAPVYNFKDNYNNFSKFIYIITILLWVKSSSKLYKYYIEYKNKNKNINTI